MFEYLKFSLTIRCCSKSIQSDLGIWRLSCSLVLLSLSCPQTGRWSLAHLQNVAVSVYFTHFFRACIHVR